MRSDPQEVVFDMAKGRSLRFADAVAYKVDCLAGSLAMTRNDDLHAAVLVDGESYLCDGASVVMIHALADSRVRLFSPSPSPAHPRAASKHVSTLAALQAWLRR
jgi:hypothetical protein